MNATLVEPREELPRDTWPHHLDEPGPRHTGYTSYPAADRYVEAFGAAEYRQALRQRAAMNGAASLAVSVHVPFHDAFGDGDPCNTTIATNQGRGRGYLADLQRELGLHAAALGRGQAVSQLHLVGGSPTLLADDELDELLAMLRAAFRLQPEADLSVEVDLRSTSCERLRRLAAMGFKRLSFTLQDVDPVVQPAVSPAWPFGQVRELVREAQALGFASVHVDLVYALPQQAPEAFVRTLAQLAELRPTRIALLAHAHLPQRFNAQRRGSEAHWPSAAQHLQMRRQAGVSLVGHGYCDIGMDLFSWPGDALAVAKRQGRLHRNFNGYTTLPDGDRIGLGVAALGCMGATCSRNAKTLAEYHDALAQGELPVVQGLALTRDDVLRRAVIMALVCQGWVDFESIEVAHLVRMREYFAPEFERLKPLQSLGLVQVNEREIQVTTAGWFSVRAVAMVFDRHLQADRARQRFSRII